MSSKAVRDAVRARLAANWATTDIHDITNQYPQPTVGSTWVALQFVAGAEEQMSIGDPGNNLWREFGTFFVHVVGPAGTGEDTILGYAETIRTIYRGQQFDGVRCYAADPPNTEPGSTVIGEDGVWFGASFAVDYQYDLTG